MMKDVFETLYWEGEGISIIDENLSDLQLADN